MGLVTARVLGHVMPNCPNPSDWLAPLNAAMHKFEIGDARRAAAFLAQIAVESAELAHLVEKLNYSAPRLMQVWPKRFHTLESAQPYARHPEKLANFVYASRLGNGDRTSGDGWHFRGRGLIQITGRSNYRSTGRALRLDLERQPELLEAAGPAALSAAWFWKSHGLNQLADEGRSEGDSAFEIITIRINGGRGGLDSRREYWKNAKSALGVT